MSSRFEQAYRVDGATKLTATLWNRIFRELDTRLVSIEEKKASFEEAERQLLQIGLDRINEALLPAAERIFRVAELGFLVASSDEEATFVEGQEASLTIREGDQRELFTPTEFVAIFRRSTPEDWVIARTLGYSRESGVLLVRAEMVKGSGGPHDDWDVSATPGAAQAVVDLFEQVSSLRQEVADDKAAVAIDKAAAQSARTEAQNARDAAIIAKTGAENALASFMTVYRGALPSAPPDGEEGHFYFDTTLQMALVYTATGWAPLFQVALGGIRQGFLTATAGQTEIDVGGNFTFINVWRNGVLLTAGVDYTTASPKIILSSPAAGGDEIAYTGYHSTDASDFYTKMAADNRFVRKDNTGLEMMSGRLEVRDALRVKANEATNAHLWLQNIDGKNRGLVYWDRNTGAVHLRVYADDGNGNDVVVGNLALRTDGTVDFNGNTVWHSGIALDAFVQGLTLSNNAGDPNNDINIAPGRARGSGVTVVISSTITKRLDANWTEGNGGGGLDTGSKAANATYHVFVIRKDDDGTGDVLLSTSATSPTVPSGWTRVQRLGAILTDGSGNIRPFVQSGNEFRFNVTDPTPDYAGTGNRAKAPLTCTLPGGIRVQGIFKVFIISASGDYQVRARLFDGANANIASTTSVYVSAGVKSTETELRQYTNTSRQIQLLIDSNAHPSTNSTLATLGWIDYQIPRIGA